VSAFALPASAAASDRLIVFQSDRAGQLDLWTMRSDGSQATRLTNDKVDDTFPEWSPNRGKIAWTRGSGSEEEIWVMNADRSGQRQVTHNTFIDGDVVWSPDSSQLAFRSIRNGNPDIFVIDVDGTNERRLTTAPGRDNGPDWSPDGNRIAFSSDRSGALAVYTTNAADGSDVQKLTPDSLEGGIPRYSPDGGALIFADAFCATCAESDLWAVNTDGSGLRQVTDSAENEIPQSWSHDGTRVAVDYATITSGTLHKSDVALVTATTGATVNITNSKSVNEAHPDWQP
jgi:Tol biopolymer transport system component